MPKRNLYSETVGKHGATVRVFERTPGGVLYIAAWDPAMGKSGGMRKKSLGHKDKDKALAHALKQAAKLQEGQEEIRSGQATLARIFTEYERHRTPRKAVTGQKEDARRIELFARVFGGKKDPHRISMAEWERFIDDRRAGTIDARGKTLEFRIAEWEDERREAEEAGEPFTRPEPGPSPPVRARTVEADLEWLNIVFNWAVKWRTSAGTYLLRENPVRGYEIPTEKNPRRPVATQDRFEAIMEAIEANDALDDDDGRKVSLGYLADLLTIVNGTGRRISAVCKLTFADLRLDKSPKAPFGAILWPADTDKADREALVPIDPDVRAALDRRKALAPGIRRTPVFPSATDASKPVTRYVADAWLRKAEELAGLEPQKGSLWHAYRRKWATERKHLPVADVMKVGGWTTRETLETAYQHADEETSLKVVLGGGELRAVGGDG